MRWLFCLVAVISLSVSHAQDWAKADLDKSPRHLEWVELKHGTRTVKAFVAYPESKDKTTVVVLIHEIMGLTDWMMSMADQFAAAGYIAIVPDFLSGMGPNGGRTDSFTDVGKAREAISGLPGKQVKEDLDAAVDYGRKLPASNGKVVVGGFCWGGTQTFQYAAFRPDLSAALVFYGSGPTDSEMIKRISAPVYGFYGENDARINATIPDSEKAMKAAGKRYEPVTYNGAGHGFMRAGQAPEAQDANKKARAQAWRRVLSILKSI